MFEFSKSAAGGLLGRFLRDESGTSAIEYAIIASGVSIVIRNGRDLGHCRQGLLHERRRRAEVKLAVIPEAANESGRNCTDRVMDSGLAPV